MSILYLCDGKKCENCRSNSCDCMHTSDIKHAVNFKDNGCGDMVEQPAMLEEKDSLTGLVKELNVMIENYQEVRLIRFPSIVDFEKQKK